MCLCTCIYKIQSNKRRWQQRERESESNDEINCVPCSVFQLLLLFFRRNVAVWMFAPSPSLSLCSGFCFLFSFCSSPLYLIHLIARIFVEWQHFAINKVSWTGSIVYFVNFWWLCWLFFSRQIMFVDWYWFAHVVFNFIPFNRNRIKLSLVYIRFSCHVPFLARFFLAFCFINCSVF